MTGRTGILAAAAALALPGCAQRQCRPGQALYDEVHRSSAFVLLNGRHVGSGFFADPRGFIVTAAHMVGGKSGAIEVVSPIAGRLGAELVAEDPGHDIALLRVARADMTFQSLSVAERPPPPGDEIFLFGDPVFQHRLLLPGTVSVPRPTYAYNPGIGCYVRVFYVTGTSPEGTSGGCWVDGLGTVVGVQSGFLNSPKAPAGIAMVAPPDAVRRLLSTMTARDVPTLGTRLDELWTQSEAFIARFPVVLNPGERSARIVTVRLERIR